MAFKLEPLPYPRDALAPHLSSETLALHHGKHHAGYVKKLNELVAGTPQADGDLETLMRGSVGPVFDNAAQIWNHDFYWRSMKPKGGGRPAGELLEAVRGEFGGVGTLREAFVRTGEAHFGSGYVWLIWTGVRLRVSSSSDADGPLPHGELPLLCADLWEHAYYVDYRNERKKYLRAFVDHLVNWEFASANWAARELAPA
jgi:Fe-Mn family superoxide dismutase